MKVIAWVEKEGRKRRGWKWVGFVVVGTRRSMSKCECATVMNRSGDLENLYLTKTRVWMAEKNACNNGWCVSMGAKIDSSSLAVWMIVCRTPDMKCAAHACMLLSPPLLRYVRKISISQKCCCWTGKFLIRSENYDVFRQLKIAKVLCSSVVEHELISIYLLRFMHSNMKIYYSHL